MRFGVCCSLEQAETALKCGAEYVEPGALGFKGLEESWDPAPYRDLPIEATNLFFPGEIVLFGPNKSNPTDVSDYISKTLERAASIGVQLMVIGSGNSRKAPAPGMPVSEANVQFVQLVQRVQREARQYGITIAPESLNRTETNVGNDLGWLANALAVAGAGFTADSFHVLYEWDANMREGQPDLEAPSEFHLIEQIPTTPSHVHFGDLPRSFPRASDPMMRAFCGRLNVLDYDARVSLECRWEDFERELPEALGEARTLL